VVRGAGVAVALALCGCVQDKPLGPDLGACADAPDGAWTYGEAGIGTCLSGPADLRFVELGGSTRLLVSNADPYNNFASGSLLVIDWDQLDLETGGRLTMDSVSAASTTLGGTRYLGQIGVIQDRADGVPLALVPARFSADTITTDADDLLHVVDLSDPSAPEPWEQGATVQVGADPMHVAVVDEHAYVTHLNESYMAVLETGSTPIRLATLSGNARVGEDTFTDVDGSGSQASLAATLIDDDPDDPDDGFERLLDETFTLTWADATWRFWVPDSGLTRWDLGTGVVVPDPTGSAIPQGAFGSPITSSWAGVDGETGAAALWIAAGGNLFLAVNSGPGVWSYDASTAAVRGGTPSTPELLDDPASFAFRDTARVVFSASLDGGPASIGFGTQDADTGVWTVDRVDALVPPSGSTYADPHVQVDPFLRSPRMWLAEQTTDGSWQVQVSTSADGTSWSEPVSTTGLPADVAAPVVNWFNGRYLGWFSVWQDGQWSLARAESLDGLDWTRLRVVESFPGATDPDVPPRAAVLTDVLGGFRVRGSATGRADGLARDGEIYAELVDTRGFAFEVSTGALALGSDFDEELGANGIVPGSTFVADGERLVVVTLVGADNRRRLGLARMNGADIDVDSVDLLPLQGLGLVEAHDPVVLGQDGDWTLLFASPDEDGVPRVRRATSTDGRTWDLQEGIAFETDEDSAVDGVLPGSVQALDGDRLRLWFTALRRTEARIGSAVSDDGGTTWTLEPDVSFDGGEAGRFDDGGASDPHFFTFDGQDWLAYTGFDGDRSRLGLVRITGEQAAPTFERFLTGAGDSAPWLPSLDNTFISQGHDHPVVFTDGDELRVLYAGRSDGLTARPRLGTAVGTPQVLYADLLYPTVGDVLTFFTIGSGGERGEIALNQTLDSVVTSAAGVSGLSYDAERGYLYVTSDSLNTFTVLDVDRAIGRPDNNVDDIEGLVRVRSDNGSSGFRDVLPLPGTGLLYATGRNPDALLVLDGDPVTDDSQKQLHEDLLLAALPLRTSRDDAGIAGEATLSGGVMALREQDGRRHLFVPHFRDNAVYVFDLDRGAYGEQVGYIPFVGENPHLIRMSPDGRYAVVANFLGQVDDGLVSSTITILDADPDSPTFLDIVATLVNR